MELTRNSGAQIIGYLENESAFYGAAFSVVSMLEAMVKENGKILTASVYLEGEYGIKGICIGVPVLLAKKGLKKIIEWGWMRRQGNYSTGQLRRPGMLLRRLDCFHKSQSTWGIKVYGRILIGML